MVPRVTAASTSLPAEPASVPAARRFVRAVLQGSGLQAAWETAQMLVSEVATNAVLHARTAFTVEVVRDGERVRVSVTDLSPAVPRQRSYGADSATGRGLRLVDTFAAAWGVDRQPGGGKTVWFEVPTAGDSATVPDSWLFDEDPEAILAGFDEPADGAGPAQARLARVRMAGGSSLRAAA